VQGTWIGLADIRLNGLNIAFAIA